VRGTAVSVLPYDPVNDQIVLIEQFRIGAYGTGQHPWLTEIVAGRAEPGEELDDVARRETLEETGCTLRALEFHCTYLANPACSTEIMHLYFGEVTASDVGGLHGLDHEDEDIRVFVVPADEAINWLGTPHVSNANFLIALQGFALKRAELRARWLAAA
jgi:ADP-ribose pyrophosphatase